MQDPWNHFVKSMPIFYQYYTVFSGIPANWKARKVKSKLIKDYNTVLLKYWFYKIADFVENLELKLEILIVSILKIQLLRGAAGSLKSIRLINNINISNSLYLILEDVFVIYLNIQRRKFDNI